MSQAEAFAGRVAQSFLNLIEGQDFEDFMAENALFKHIQDEDLELTIRINGRGEIEMDLHPFEDEEDEEEISVEQAEYELALIESMNVKFKRFSQIMVMLFGEQAHNIPVGEHVFAAIFSPEEMDLFRRLF